MSDDPEEPVRKLIIKRLRETKRSLSWLSKSIKRNEAYIHQYVNDGKPRELAYRDKVTISKLLEIPLSELVPYTTDLPASAGAEARGISADVEPFALPRDVGLLPAQPPERVYYKVLSSPLDRHPFDPITDGTIITVDERFETCDQLKTEDRVLVELWDRESKGMTMVIREFVAPRLLITNSDRVNAIINMDDGSIPYEAMVKGKIIGTHRFDAAIKPPNGTHRH